MSILDTKNVENGENTSFWFDAGCGGPLFAKKIRRLHDLTLDINISIANDISSNLTNLEGLLWEI